MSSAVIFCTVTSSVLWCITPRLFRWCDAHLAHRRLLQMIQKSVNAYNAETTSQTQRLPERPRRESSEHYTSLSAQPFEHLARATRANLTARDALQTVLHNHDSFEAQELCQLISTDMSLQAILQQPSSSRDGSRLRALLLASLCDGVFVPSALEQCATSIRNTHRLETELRIATSQARLTLKVLTILPVVFLCAAILTSKSARSAITSPGMLMTLLVGLCLNRLGAAWATRQIRSIMSEHPDAEVVELVDFLNVQLLSGHTLHSALMSWRQVNSLGATIAHAVHAGEPFVLALEKLKVLKSEFADNAVDLITSALHDGQPVATAVSTLSREAQRMQYQHHQERIRQLPVALSAPMVLCTLPSFILLTVVPIIVGQLSHLTYT